MLNSTKFFKKLWSPISKWQIKLALALLAFVIVIVVIIFTQLLANELINHEKRLINLYAKTYENYSDPSKNLENLIFFLDEITTTITFPVIMTNIDDEPIEDFASYTLNVPLSNEMTIDEQRRYLKIYISRMAANYPPIILKDDSGEVVYKIFYTHSDLIDRLKMFPLIALIMISAFIIVSYIAFSGIRRNEQSKVWIGMAREAAHQLGTPLSSLLAWIELLKYSKDQPGVIEETLNEMSNDINRLQIITTRFSKIGSMPEKERIDLNILIEEVCVYFEKRLPHLGRKVEINRDFEDAIMVEVNKDLIAWVFENLLKNAAEAIEDKLGVINISTHCIPGKRAVVYLADNGKGLSSVLRRQIFFPGFTTKKRGWGLGLSLARRIIEEYHRGKIYIKGTAVGKGTTFAVEIPITETGQKS